MYNYDVRGKMWSEPVSDDKNVIKSENTIFIVVWVVRCKNRLCRYDSNINFLAS